MSGARGWSKSRPWLGDEEMAKKDDDRAAHSHSRKNSQWNSAPRTPRRSSVARLLLYAVAIVGLIYFWLQVFGSSAVAQGAVDQGELPEGRGSFDHRLRDAPHDPPRAAPRPPKKVANAGKEAKKKEEKAPQSKESSEKATTKSAPYEGPIRLPMLGQSLYSIMETSGSAMKNRNVLFAAASLQSAATLLPFACQMAFEKENYVHFSLTGRSDIKLKELLKINGIDKSCPLILHDARPDHAATSADSRLMVASARSLYHINMYMHPQAIFIDSTSQEEDYFLLGTRDQVRATNAALIELPHNPGAHLSWLTKLDSSSLAAWNDVHFDILVHAPPTGSANIKRLLKSLHRADLSAVSIPHLTIELPPVMEADMRDVVAGYRWPNPVLSLTAMPQMLSLHRRISRPKMTEEESSVRFLESFWPNKPRHSHVLVLSPHTEVTPQFFHYVKYVLLDTLYSTNAERGSMTQRLMAISLSAPTTHLDASKPFAPPKLGSKSKSGTGETSFLWQAPTSDAVLFLGDKWIELHAYVSQLLEKQHAISPTPALLATKEVSKKYPAWLEHVLQLSRLRGYVTLYPGAETANTVIGVHADVKDIPEEYQGEGKRAGGVDEDISDSASDLFDSGSQVNMLATLPNDGKLLSLKTLPILSWDGEVVDANALEKDAQHYAQTFRHQVGQCDEAKARVEADVVSARDLFCKPKSKT